MQIHGMFAYNQHSQGGAELAAALGTRRIRHRGSAFVARADKNIINWGASSRLFNSDLNACNVLNSPTAVDIAADKSATFRRFRDAGVSCPEFTNSRDVAREWLEGGSFVFARTQLRASSGRGIAIMDPEHPDTWEVNAPLYVKYVNKRHEYRVHVFNGRVIDTQRKGLREEFRGQEDVNWKVRNLENGFVFVRNDGHVVPQCVLDCGVDAVRAIPGLLWGAVDVVYNQTQNRAYAIEVNTAPGLQGTTVENYANAFRNL